MTPQFPTARLDIDLAALLHNFRTLRTRAGTAEIAPVVKADAYGLGMARVAAHLAQNGARTFFVARLDEGVALRKTLGAGPVVYVLDGLGAGETSVFTGHDLRPVLNHADQYVTWLRGPASLKAALHIDTGMNRLGLRPEEIQSLTDRGDHELSLVISHLACGDEPGHPLNHQQLMTFRHVLQALPGIPISMANSAGAFLDPAYHFDLLRPGISLYGGGPFGVAHPDIQPVAHVAARVLQVRDLHAGETVGYGATFTAPRAMRLATLGIGYADGLLRSFAEHGSVRLGGEPRQLTGRVSMDVISVEATGLDVKEGDWAEILGTHQNLDAAAAAAGTIGYELLTRLGARLPRRYS